nr:immunoglobulin heavy chain junction region [Macaca mulatta]MOW19694.1 immunoglobulin heavy chain junction region [Macaca mulatta]MOW21519.1 immunoglobulin heavy chain junction region [Macaca mulatta]MOW21790.1 immunoglobulin heavy chain junction region [Macaca mulatta]MOW22542.1 immunoglobulin heavy chain junction region [Macaca mulatta]
CANDLGSEDGYGNYYTGGLHSW